MWTKTIVNLSNTVLTKVADANSKSELNSLSVIRHMFKSVSLHVGEYNHLSLECDS